MCEVFAQVRSLKSEGDSVWLQLRLENDLFVQSFFSLNAVEEDRVEIYGSQGKLSVDHFQSLGVEITTAKLNQLTRFDRLRQKFQTTYGNIPYIFEKLWSPNNEPSYKIALTQFFLPFKPNNRLFQAFGMVIKLKLPLMQSKNRLELDKTLLYLI